jgi:hypothetical protein
MNLEQFFKAVKIKQGEAYFSDKEKYYNDADGNPTEIKRVYISLDKSVSYGNVKDTNIILCSKAFAEALRDAGELTDEIRNKCTIEEYQLEGTEDWIFYLKYSSLSRMDIELTW